MKGNKVLHICEPSLKKMMRVTIFSTPKKEEIFFAHFDLKTPTLLLPQPIQGNIHLQHIP
jgi:hypothetical protein